ncbi:hypothetical protein [Terriglobus aquaticus]|uniref:Uncharacterized protein n=1 Tax=Terriglobus aquaticus TaxID=940139 RepID=A0ABW9KJI4_9BACT|nr:hypothetical protein [Terriglobus aquaticus]
MKRRPKIFSVTKAVKSNARDRVGMPRPGTALPDEKTKAEHRARKHKVTLNRLLQENGTES